jgi:hypothetical protein
MGIRVLPTFRANTAQAAEMVERRRLSNDVSVINACIPALYPTKSSLPEAMYSEDHCSVLIAQAASNGALSLGTKKPASAGKDGKR